MLDHLIKKLGMDANSRQLKKMMPIVDSINIHYNLLQDFGSLDNEQFKEIAHKRTTELKKEVQEKLKESAAKHESLKNDFDNNQNYKKAVEKDKKEILGTVLPEAFALVKEASRRTLKTKDNQPMVHFDVQLMGGMALHEGKMAEMKTGEGKTLVLTLPVYLNALTGEGVHVVTVNEYLAQRDAKWMGPIYDMLGVSVGINLSENGYCIYDKDLLLLANKREGLKKDLNVLQTNFEKNSTNIKNNNPSLPEQENTISPTEENAEATSNYERLITEIESKIHSLNEQAYKAVSDKKKEAYKADVTYGVNHEFGFDYLRDNTTSNVEDKVQRMFNFAIVDEVDNILIDDARTAHILSAPIEGDVSIYNKLKPDVIALMDKQNNIIDMKYHVATAMLNLINDGLKEENKPGVMQRLSRLLPKLEQADPDRKIISEGSVYLLNSYLQAGNLTKEQKNKTLDELSDLLFQIKEGNPRNKIFSPDFIKQNPMILKLTTQGEYTHNALRRDEGKGDEILKGLFYIIKEKDKNVYLTEQGMGELSERAEMFTLPDLITELSNIDSLDITLQEKQEKKNKIQEEYSKKSESTHAIQKLLYAYCMFDKDVDYVVKNGEVVIIDSSTGRKMPGRRWNEGMHEAVEAKEGVKIQKPSQTLATISLQNYFRMYNKLAGTSGTVATEAQEFMNTYKIDTLVIPTNKLMIRKDHDDAVYKTEEEKWDAVVEEIKTMYQSGRPVLVGTASIEKSELLSRLLQQKNIPHEVLNATRASEDGEYEAKIVSGAGKPGAVTISTNMAGRGTDIILGEGVAEKGGLHVIGTEKHESRRIDNQLRGRAGRQGDQGSSKFMISLEDDLMRMHGGDRIKKVMTMIGIEKGESITHPIVTKAMETAQKRLENYHADIRKNMLKYDDVNNAQRAAIYADRNELMGLANHEELVNNIAHDLLETIIMKYLPQGEPVEEKKFNELNSRLRYLFDFDVKLGEGTSIEDIKHEKFKEQLHELINISQQHIPERSIKMSISSAFENIRSKYRFFDHMIKKESIPEEEKEKKLEALISKYKAEVASFETKIKETYDNELKKKKGDMGRICKNVILQTVDNKWRDHLVLLEDLREGVYLRAYAQKDPLVEYKKESSKLFDQMMEQVEEEIVQTVFKKL
ncbi:hypothetical protein FJZ53_04255 [Candidatus Woesearchaeota archaeon]|nr:hypothetical protein [Candidatus Woesearchaeota archaeon]